MGLLSVASAALSTGSLPPPADILSSLTSANEYFMKNNIISPQAQDCGWTRGAYYAGHMEHFAVATDSNEKTGLMNWALRWASTHNYTCNGLWQDPNNIACGMGYVALYDAAPEDYKLALSVTMDKSVTRWQGYDWWWVDTLFMGLPSMLLYANRTGDVRFQEWALKEYNETTNGGVNSSQPALWDLESNLYWRDHTYISQRNTDGSKIFWGRGNGWAIGAMALAHRATADPSLQEEFSGRLKAMAQALLPLQQSDGFWRANLLFPTDPKCPNPETTSTSFFTFGMAYGINSGILDSATYLPVVTKAWAALSSTALKPSGLVGWCQPAGAGPNPATSNSTSDFCVGAFLLAGSETYRVASKFLT